MNFVIPCHARFLNQIIYLENDGPPEINDILQKYEVFSTTDLTPGFFQIPIEKESRKYTAFVFEGKANNFCRIPFGTKTASNGFVRAINNVLGDELADSLTVYVDDMLITSKWFSEHLVHLDILFTKIGEAGLTLKLSKFFLCKDNVKFLGLILTFEHM